MDMVDMVHHAFYHYDTVVQFNSRNFHACSDNAGGSHSPSLPGSPHLVDPESVPHDDDYVGDPLNVDPMGSVDPYHKAPVPADVQDGCAGLSEPYDSDNFEVDLLDEDLDADAQEPFSEALMEECARLQLFAGSRLLTLSATLLLLNCCQTHGCSSMFINKLFKLLSQSLQLTADIRIPGVKEAERAQSTLQQHT
jgi:hypothetical protein